MEEKNTHTVTKEVTVGEFFRSVFAKVGKWIFLGVTILVTALSFVLLQFVIAPESMQTYRYTLDFPGVSEGRYPDGTRFNYFDCIEKENLIAIKNSNSAFAHVDVEKMVEKDDIVILRDAEEYLATGRTVYELSVSAKYFSNVSVADAFLRAVAETPIRYVVNSIEGLQFSTHLNNFDSEKDYYSQITVLTNQKILLSQMFDGLINRVSGEFVAIYNNTPQTLLQYRADLNYVFTSTEKSELLMELRTNGYLLGNDVEYAASRYRIWEKSLSNLEQKRANLLAGSNVDASSEAIAEQLVAINNEKDSLLRAQETLSAWVTDGEFNKTLATAALSNQEFLESNVEFAQKLAAYREDLVRATEVYRAVYQSVTDVESRVVYETRKAEGSGGMSPIVAAIGSIVIGVIVGLVAAWAVSKWRNPVGKQVATEQTAE